MSDVRLEDLLSAVEGVASGETTQAADFRFAHAETILPLAVLLQLRSEEHTSELQSRFDLVCRLLLEKKKKGHRIALIDNACYDSYDTPLAGPDRGNLVSH